MPQLDPSVFATQLFWLALTFIPLYLILWKVALPRITDIRAARRERIADDLEKAETLREEAATALAEYEAAFATATARAQTALREAAHEMAEEATRQREALAERLAEETAEAVADAVETSDGDTAEDKAAIAEQTAEGGTPNEQADDTAAEAAPAEETAAEDKGE